MVLNPFGSIMSDLPASVLLPLNACGAFHGVAGVREAETQARLGGFSGGPHPHLILQRHHFRGSGRVWWKVSLLTHRHTHRHSHPLKCLNDLPGVRAVIMAFPSPRQHRSLVGLPAGSSMTRQPHQDED